MSPGCGPSLCARLPGLLAMRPCCSVSVGFPRGIRVVVVGGTCRLCWWGGLFGVVWSRGWGGLWVLCVVDGEVVVLCRVAPGGASPCSP